jgi:hypothetical protein
MEILTALLVIITGIYVYLTYNILQINRDVLVSSVRPYVIIDFRSSGPLVELLLKNTGRTAAYDISVEMTPKVKVILRGTPQDAQMLREKLPFLPTGKDVVEFLCSWRELEQQNVSLVFAGNISYRDGTGKEYKEAYSLDFSFYKGMAHIGRPDVPKELEKIRETLQDISRKIK